MYRIKVNFQYQKKNYKIKSSFVSPELRPLGSNKTGFHSIISYFIILGKLSIIQNRHGQLQRGFSRKKINLTLKYFQLKNNCYTNTAKMLPVLWLAASLAVAAATTG